MAKTLEFYEFNPIFTYLHLDEGFLARIIHGARNEDNLKKYLGEAKFNHYRHKALEIAKDCEVIKLRGKNLHLLKGEKNSPNKQRFNQMEAEIRQSTSPRRNFVGAYRWTTRVAKGEYEFYNGILACVLYDEYCNLQKKLDLRVCISEKCRKGGASRFYPSYLKKCPKCGAGLSTYYPIGGKQGENKVKYLPQYRLASDIESWSKYSGSGNAGNILPLWAALAFCRIAKISEKNIQTHTKMWRGMRTGSVTESFEVRNPKSLELNKSLAYLLGLFMSGGCITLNTVYYCLRHYGKKKGTDEYSEILKWTVNTIQKSLNECFGEVRYAHFDSLTSGDSVEFETFISQEGNCYEIRIPTNLTDAILKFIEKHEKTKPESHFSDKKIFPEFIKNSKKEIRIAFLKGVFDDCALFNVTENAFFLSANVNLLYAVKSILKNMGFKERNNGHKYPITITHLMESAKAELHISSSHTKKILRRILLPLKERHPVLRSRIQDFLKE